MVKKSAKIFGLVAGGNLTNTFEHPHSWDKTIKYHSLTSSNSKKKERKVKVDNFNQMEVKKKDQIFLPDIQHLAKFFAGYPANLVSGATLIMLTCRTRPLSSLSTARRTPATRLVINLKVQPDQLNMAVCLVNIDLSSVRYCTRVPWTSHFVQGTRPCLTGHTENKPNSSGQIARNEEVMEKLHCSSERTL